jgi:hypothetical protein
MHLEQDSAAVRFRGGMKYLQQHDSDSYDLRGVVSAHYTMIDGLAGTDLNYYGVYHIYGCLSAWVGICL